MYEEEIHMVGQSIRIQFRFSGRLIWCINIFYSNKFMTNTLSKILLIAFVAYIGVCSFSYASKVDEAVLGSQEYE